MKKDMINCPVELFQKPPEIFSGIMPIGRQLFSSRLSLRRFKQSDSVELLALFKNNRRYLAQWLQPQPEALRVQNIIDLIKEDHLYVKKGLRLDLGIFDSLDDRILGRIALHSVDYGIQRSAGLSYWIAEDASGKGLMTEAMATIISFAFEEACLHRIWLNILSDNKPSQAIATKLGFRKEGELKQNLFINGSWQNSTLFAMLEDEYDALADKWIAKKWLGSAI